MIDLCHLCLIRRELFTHSEKEILFNGQIILHIKRVNKPDDSGSTQTPGWFRRFPNRGISARQ
jgi:hypothetical protein